MLTITKPGHWVDGFRGQDKIPDKYMKENNLQRQDWRPEMYGQLKGN